MAGPLLRERGEALRMEDVSAAAGVGKGTLYRNYPDRAALAEAVLDGLARDVQRRALVELAPGDGPALERLDRFVAMMFAFVADNLDLLCVRGAGSADPRLAPSHRWQRMVVAGLLAEAARGGECAEPDLDYLPDAILGLIDPGLVRHQLRGGDRARADVLAGLRRAVAGAARGG